MTCRGALDAAGRCEQCGVTMHLCPVYPESGGPPVLFLVCPDCRPRRGRRAINPAALIHVN